MQNKEDGLTWEQYYTKASKHAEGILAKEYRISRKARHEDEVRKLFNKNKSYISAAYAIVNETLYWERGY